LGRPAENALNIWLFIGLHEHQPSMCQNLSLLVLFSLLLVVSFCSRWVSYLGYPTSLEKKALMLLLFHSVRIEVFEEGLF
jgi:cell division inhibitor SulA